jgi:hypothetical protein
MKADRENELRPLAAAAIQMVRQRIRWKAGKDTQHLEKRIDRGHLPPGTTINDYNQIIPRILNEPEGNVYQYPFGQTDYFAVTGEIDGTSWLVLISAKGIMETAFPPDDLQDYLIQNNYVFLGKLKELTL